MTHLIKRLETQWQEDGRLRTIHAVISLQPDGLVLGAGTVLAPRDRAHPDGKRLDLDGDAARLLTLASVGYGFPVPASILSHIRRADRQWELGEDCLAAIHLAFTGLGKLAEPREAARRLFIVDGLLAAGVPAPAILDALGIDGSELDRLEKYSQEQPRVPAGNGRISGRWVEIGERILGRLSSSALGRVALFLGRLAARGGNIGMILLAHPAGGRAHSGEIPGGQGLFYEWTDDESDLRIIHADADGQSVVLRAQLDAGGRFRNAQGEVVARRVGDQIVVDTSALDEPGRKAISDEEEPKLCPEPGPDKAGRNGDVTGNPNHQKDRDYEDYVKRRINPENPTPRGFGYQLPNPDGGRIPVHYDDCEHATGKLLEYKGTGFADRIAVAPFMEEAFQKKWTDQASRQIAASQGRELEWHFAEKGAAESAERLFRDNKEHPEFERIRVVHAYWQEGMK